MIEFRLYQINASCIFYLDILEILTQTRIFQIESTYLCSRKVGHIVTETTVSQLYGYLKLPTVRFRQMKTEFRVIVCNNKFRYIKVTVLVIKCSRCFIRTKKS